MIIKRNIAVSDDGFIFDSHNGNSYSVNELGAQIINLIKQKKSKDEIKAYILEKYQTDSSTIEKDLIDFTSMLNRFNLVENND